MGVRWDPTDRAFKADPYPTYRALLEKEPLHHSPFGLDGGVALRGLHDGVPAPGGQQRLAQIARMGTDL